MKGNARFLPAIICLSLLTVPCYAFAQTAADYKTTEYYASKGLDILHAADAYALGYTGKGVLAGVSDLPVNVFVPELETKTGTYDAENDHRNNAEYIKYNYNGAEHGTHVAGIVVGSKDNIGMHGVAFDADVLGEWFDYHANGALFRPDLFKNFLADSRNKVINCSWGWPQNSLDTDLGTKTDGGNIVDFAYMTSDAVVNEYPYLTNIQTATSNDKLLIFSAGNSGHTTQAYTKLAFQWQNPILAYNYIGVSAADNFNLTANSDGSLKGDHLVTYFSDLAKFSEDSFVAASGQEIYSANAEYYDPASVNFGKLDIPMNGTSMATPYVTGVAALVQQAYPYLSGKQIGDVLLSTANTQVALPEYQVFLGKKEQGYKLESMIIIFTGAPSGKTEEELKQLAKNYYQSYYADNGYYSKEIWDKCVDRKLTALYYAGLQEFWGQGLVDAGKAVQGLGALNARRLTSEDISSAYTVQGTKTAQALYPLDTQGYNSIWSNDIKEIKAGLIAPDSTESDLKDRYQYYYYNWINGNAGTVTAETAALTQSYIDYFNNNVEASGLKGLSVGLLKQGNGTLALTGANTYKGSTVVDGGAIALTGSVAGDAYTLAGGTFTGTGTINGNLDNKGNLVPGLTADTQNLFSTTLAGTQGAGTNATATGTANSTAVGTLTVKGDLNSTGKFTIAVNGANNSKLNVKGTSTITGTKLDLDNNAPPILHHQYNYLISQGGIVGNVTSGNASPYVTLQTTVAGTKGYFSTDKNATSLGSLPGMTSSENSVGNALNSRVLNALTNDPAANSATTNKLNNVLFQNENTSRLFTKQITSEARAQLLNQSPMSSLTNETVYSRLDTVDFSGNLGVTTQVASLDGEAPQVKTSVPLALDATNNVWLKLFRGYENYTYSDDLENKSFGGAIGYDHALNLNTRLGGLISYGVTNYSTDNVNGDSYDWRVGIYGDHKNGDWEYQALATYGRNRYDLDRFVTWEGTKTNSEYKAKVWDGEVKARYFLPSTQNKTWQVKPYGKLSYTHSKQDAYAETGSSVFKQSLNSATNNSWRGEVGVELNRNLTKQSSWGGSIGYKRILSGLNPELNGTFVGDTNSFSIRGDNDRNYITYSLNTRGSLGGQWMGQAEFRGEASGHSHKEIVSVIAKYSF